MSHQFVGKQRQITKYCERCRVATPHQIRENNGLIAKICVVCLRRGDLWEKPRAEEAAAQHAERTMVNEPYPYADRTG